MAEITLPCTLFETQKWMDDYGAADMRCGDLSEAQLKNQFNLQDVSTRVDPYTLTRITPFTQPQSMFYGMHGAGEKVSREECIKILFDEMRHLSTPFAAYGPYRHLISKMISHMQYGNGKPFQDLQLDAALKEQIESDRSSSGSLVKLRETIKGNIVWQSESFPLERKYALNDAISSSILPKFTRVKDRFNGLGITVHDIWAAKISLNKLEVKGNSFSALVNYKIQDHFGLDRNDVMTGSYHSLRFFRIWFLLQHYNAFAYKPFMTDICATLTITGSRYA